MPVQQAIARIAEESSDRMMAQIADTEYGPHLSFGEESVERMIEAEREEFVKTLQRLGVDGDIMDLLFIKSRMERVARELKTRLFEGKEEVRPDDPEIERGLKKKFSDSVEIDDWSVRRFEDLSVEKIRKIGDKKLASRLESLFIKRRSMREDGAEDGVALREMEDAFLREADLRNGGVAPVMALMIRKMRVERMIRMAVGARRLGMDLTAIQYEISKIRGIV